MPRSSTHAQHTSLVRPIAPARTGLQCTPTLSARRLRRMIKLQARKNEDTSTTRLMGDVLCVLTS